MELSELIAGFAEKFDVESFSPDENGKYCCMIDDMPIEFSEIDGRQVLISGLVCDKPPENSEELYAVLMEAMFMGVATAGAFFAMDSATGNVVLQCIQPLDALDLDGFKQMLEGYANILETWRGFVQDLTPAAIKAQRAKAAESQMFGMGTGDFMRV